MAYLKLNDIIFLNNGKLESYGMLNYRIIKTNHKMGTTFKRSQTNHYLSKNKMWYCDNRILLNY